MLLIECKHSISNVREVVRDISDGIEETEKHRKELEELIGSSVDQIEYVLCCPAIYAKEALDEIESQNIPLCFWGCDMFTKEIRLFSRTDSLEQEIKQGRVHKDKNLNKILFKGIVSELSATRCFPILPSSHMGSLLTQVNPYLCLERISQRLENLFSFSDVYNILFKQYQKYPQLSAEWTGDISQKMIETALEKGIFVDLTQDILEIDHKTFRITGRQTSARVVAEKTEKNYTMMNARRSAETSTLERSRRETGFTDLESFIED